MGVRASTLIAGRARRAAIAAVHKGNDPKYAVRNVILGRHGEAGIVPIIGKLMLAADLSGRKRTMTQARPSLVARKNFKLSGSVYDQTIEFLQKRLDLQPDQLSALQKQYDTHALQVTTLASDDLEKQLQQAVLNSVQQGEGLRATTIKLADAFKDAGFAAGESYQLETICRTQTQMAYGAGRWNSLQDEAIQEILWGYEYVAIMDDRVRETHAAMNGVKAEKDDPLWGTWWCPCGYNCRCTNLEIFEQETATVDRPDVIPDPGFAFNPGTVFNGLRAA